MEKEKLYIYLISSTIPAIKIGVSSNVSNRMKCLQGGSAVLLTHRASFELPHSVALEAEKLCHKQLCKKRMKGEWFNASIKEGVDVIRSSITHLTNIDNFRDIRHPHFKSKKLNQKAIKEKSLKSKFKRKPGRKKSLTPYQIIEAKKEWFESNLSSAVISKKYKVANNYFFREFGPRGFSPVRKRRKVVISAPRKPRKARKSVISRGQWDFMLAVVIDNPLIGAAELAGFEGMPRHKRRIPKRTTLTNYMDKLRDGLPYPFDN